MFGKYKHSYEIRRSQRRTMAIEITPDGRVIVRCPMKMTAVQADKFVREKGSWIEKHLARLANRPAYPAFTTEEISGLKKQAREVIIRRAAELAPIVGVAYGRIAIRAQHGRWGSCSRKDNLNFNCLLVLTPPYVLDYIVIHELCHIKHHNHSADFWAEVARVMPEYKQAEAWLKASGGGLIASLPK